MNSNDGTARAARCVGVMESRGVLSDPEVTILLEDLSGSMNSKDWPPSRLQGAKDAALAFLERKRAISPRDRVGVISFANDVRVEQKPIPVETGFNDLSKGIVATKTRGTTNIGAGLVACHRAFRRVKTALKPCPNPSIDGCLSTPGGYHAPPRPKYRLRVILLTDGRHNGDIDPIPVAKNLKRMEVKVDCIGIGGAHSDVDESLLKQLASTDANGKPRYWYIGERLQLIKKFESLATGLRGIGT